PRGLTRLLERGLSREPQARFSSMNELLRALRSVRSARARWLAAAAVVFLASVAAAWLGGARSLERRQCDAAGAALSSPWTADTRAQLTHAFGATHVSWAGEVLARVTARLDAWARQFDAAKREACEPSLFGPRVSAAELGLRLECLAEAARQARGVISQLREPDASTQLNAVAATEGLVIDCRAPAAKFPRPVVGSEDVERLRDDFARVYALLNAGRAKAALELAKTLPERAEANGDERLRLAAQVSLGIAQERNNDFPSAVKQLQAAIRRADVLQDDRLRAQAWVSLLQAEYRAGHYERALELEAGALGAAERVGDPWLQSEALLFLGGALSARDQLQRAQDAFQQAVALREKAWGPEDRRTAFALSSLGNALAMQGELTGAIDAHRRSLHAAEAALGPRHPAVATLRGNLGDDFLYGLDPKAAVAELGGAVELLAGNDPKSREVANLSTDLGFAQLLAGNAEEALATFERALSLWNALAPQHPLRGMSLLGRAEALKALGREVPLADLEAALQLVKVLPPFERGRVQLALGEALEKTDPPRARTLVHDAEQGLSTTTLPLVAAARARAQRWLEAHR
ncbi:MAG: tetratricopeptide repeat protein, partial [Myxococcota bacterium]